ERNTLDNTDDAAPATLLRSDGTPSQTISFLGTPSIHASSVDTGTFAQDTWTPRPWLTIEPGIRWDHSSGIGDAFLSPRLAATIKPDTSTTIAGSFGRFGDKVPLLALAFPWLPARGIQLYDATGAAVVPLELVPNMVGAPLVTPRAMRWNLELDQHFASF